MKISAAEIAGSGDALEQQMAGSMLPPPLTPPADVAGPAEFSETGTGRGTSGAAC
jgi:hypothetical protein